MKEYITLDAHKYYSLAARERVDGGAKRHDRIEHRPGSIRTYLEDIEPGTTVAVEATGNWYWITDEIEAAGGKPALVHPRKAKLMLGSINKTDKLDADGLNRLQRTGTLPVVWIAPAAVRDLRELSRTRMFLSRQRTRVKNRIQANLAKYGLTVTGYTDPMGKAALLAIRKRLAKLPPQTAIATGELLAGLDHLTGLVAAQEKRLAKLIKQTPQMRLLQTIPGIGRILSVVIALEVGEVSRFPDGAHLAAYAGTTPRVHSSGGKTRMGRLRCDVNRTLKWAFVEAANSIVIHITRNAVRHHPAELYRRISARKGHQKAVGAVARHLAEAVWHVLDRGEPYHDPGGNPPDLSPRAAQARTQHKPSRLGD
jgi:transposase